MLMYNLYSSVLRAVGDARSPLLFLGIAATINIVLDLLFVIVFNMGTAGRLMQQWHPKACLVYSVYCI